ncbi:hypothetical protein D3C75_731560 [compost metagenome]
MGQIYCKIDITCLAEQRGGLLYPLAFGQHTNNCVCFNLRHREQRKDSPLVIQHLHITALMTGIAFLITLAGMEEVQPVDRILSRYGE